MLCCGCYQCYVPPCVFITLRIFCLSEECELPKVLGTRSFSSLDFPEVLICAIAVGAIISACSVVVMTVEGISAVYGPVFIFDMHYILHLSN